MDLTSLGKKKLKGDSPSGKDVKYDPEFEELQVEVERSASAAGVMAADWDKIVKLSANILDHKSKDLRVAGYLAVGLIYTKKAEGIFIGMEVYLDLIEHFWESLYPIKSRPTGRSRAIDWWIEKTAGALKRIGRFEVTQEQVNQIQERFEKTRAFLREQLSDAPGFDSILTQLNSAVPPPPPPPDAVAQTGTTATGDLAGASSSMASPGIGQVSTEQDAKRALNTISDQIRSVSSWLASQDKTNPLAYILNRQSIWFSVAKLPPAEGGQTLIPPPDERLGDQLKELKTENKHEELLKLSEECSSQYIFWLDLHRYANEALTGMGDAFQPAADAVGRETAAFLQRIQGIETLSFSDGTPFADSVTRHWLREISSAGQSMPNVSVASASSGPEREELQKELDEAARLLKKKMTVEAVKRLQAMLRSCPSVREQLYWRMEFCQLFMKTKNSNLMFSQLEQILEEVDKYRLDEYDPSVAVKCITLAWQAHKRQYDSGSKKKAEELLARISKIDMAELVRMGEA